MKYLCVICLTTGSIGIGEICLRSGHFTRGIHNRCNNHICQKCNKYCKFNKYPAIFRSHRYEIPLCSDKCATNYFLYMDYDSLSDDNPILLQQKDIRNSIFLHLYTSVNNYMINDLTSIVINYLIEN